MEEPKEQIEEQPKHFCDSECLALAKKLYCESNNLDEKKIFCMDNGDGEGVFFVVDGRKVFPNEYCICERFASEPELKTREQELKKQFVRDEFKKIRDYKYFKKILEFLGKSEDELLF
jgi:hypothetical protein